MHDVEILKKQQNYIQLKLKKVNEAVYRNKRKVLERIFGIKNDNDVNDLWSKFSTLNTIDNHCLIDYNLSKFIN